MIDQNAKLTVLHDDNGSFINNTDSAADYLRDQFNITLIAAEDYLYIGYSKPFASTFAAFTTPNVNSNTLVGQYYNGTSWVTTALIDDTKGMTRDGFISWDKENMKEVSVNGISKFYIRIKPSADHSATVVKGMNIVFADDNALKQEFSEIDNETLLPKNETTHLVNHVAARNTIVQMLRNKGYDKTTAGSTKLKNITAFDLHDLEQVRQAATMLCLSKIFFGKADNKEDIWWAKYDEYQDKFEESFELLLLSIDTNDNGLEETQENQEPLRVQRWLR